MKKWIYVLLVVYLMLINTVNTYAMQIENTEIMGDKGVVTIEDFETTYRVTTPARVTAEILVPQGFGQSCYIILMDENGVNYRMSCTENNEYRTTMYLSEGKYFVDYVGVYGDNISQFSFDFVPEEVIEVKSEKENVLTYQLSDYVKIEEQIQENENRLKEMGIDIDKKQQTQDIMFFPSGIDGILIDGNGKTYYEVTHSGSTNTKCIVTGNAIADADVLMRVTKSGVLGEAVIELSKDGGKTFDTSAIITDTLYIGSLGVSISFTMENDTEQFMIGDSFSFKVRENFSVMYYSSMDSGYITVFGHPKENHKLLIRMLSSGGRGNSRFTVSYDLGNSIAIQDIVPKNGKYDLDDNITIIFSDHDFAKDLEFMVDIVSNDTTVNLIPAYIICVILAVLVTVAYVYLIRKKENADEYRINVYKSMQEEHNYE